MNTKEAYKHGVTAGIGAALNTDVQDGEDAESAAYEGEQNARQYTPFEFLAHAINNVPAGREWWSSARWASYERGVERGIRQGLRERNRLSQTVRHSLRRYMS